MVRHDGITPTFSRTQVMPGLTGTAIVIAVALAIGVRGAAPAGAAARIAPGPAVAAKHQASALTRCLRWARRSRLARRRARRRRACRHAAAQKQRRANPSRSALFGVSTGGAIPNEDPATLGRDLDADRRVGAGWLRVDINWAMIQNAGPRSYNWAPIDRVVGGATGRGLRVLGTIVYTPRWARPRGTAATYGPDPGQYAAFAATAVRHYAAMGVHAYEVWNEPNNSGAWTPRPDPAAYTRLLRAAYPAIKGADPQATVITGGTGPAPNDGTEIPPLDFLNAVYADGGAGSFDAVAHHPYTWPANPGDPQPWSPWYQMYGTAPSLRSLMIAHGDGGKKIWATEFGAPTNGPPGSHISEAAQASMVKGAFAAWRRYQWAGPLFVFQGRDLSSDPRSRENFFGLLRNNFSPKPAFAALQAALYGS